MIGMYRLVLCTLFGLWLGLGSVQCDPNDATLVFFWGNSNDNSQTYELNEANQILQHPEFRPIQNTVLYVHGYNESLDVGSVPVILEAYQQRGDQNIIILDWSSLAAGSYLLNAVVNARRLGPRIADVLIGLFDAGLVVEQFHLVGHSLGGQVSGIVGRNVRSSSRRKYELPRISALDPAFPGFYPSLFHLSATDAKLVDVIHTDAGLYGAPVSTGSIDFWPNSGKSLQPGCPRRSYIPLSDNDLCSHRRSWYFWADSVANRNGLSFPAVSARNWRNFQNGRRVDTTEVVHMGIDCETGITGDYYLQTNAAKPFNRGLEGTAYDNTINV